MCVKPAAAMAAASKNYTRGEGMTCKQLQDAVEKAVRARRSDGRRKSTCLPKRSKFDFDAAKSDSGRIKKAVGEAGYQGCLYAGMRAVDFCAALIDDSKRNLLFLIKPLRGLFISSTEEDNRPWTTRLNTAYRNSAKGRRALSRRLPGVFC
jgi:hypothetical protein